MGIKEKEARLSPVLKYPGGKEKELKYILPNLPTDCNRYYEPFIGGGAVFFSVDSDAYLINDKSGELISLYRMVKEQNPVFLEKLREIDQYWSRLEEIARNHLGELVGKYRRYKEGQLDAGALEEELAGFVQENSGEFVMLLNESFPMACDNFLSEQQKSLINKLVRMKNLEEKKGNLPQEDVNANIEGALKNAFYKHFRYLYNHIEELRIDTPVATAIYFFVREFCYASMFRYNRQGEFNVPYGGISYNRKSILKKIQYFSNQELVKQLEKTVVENMDFEAFFHEHPPEKDDFIFLDPPYDTEFSTYALNEFGKEDQIRLSRFLIEQCRANFMLVIKNTDFIRNLYPANRTTANGKTLYVGKFDKKYVVSFQDRNDKEAEHLLITNYPLEA